MTQISKDELDKIVRSIENFSSSVEPSETSKREQLKRLSDSRVAGWSDTLSAKRKAKLSWKAEKEKQEEERRKALDAEEAKLREQLRNQTLQRAEKMVMERTEKVRQFRSQKMLTDALTTRNEQVKEKKAMAQKEVEHEKKWHSFVIKSVQDANQKAAHEEEQRKRNRDLIAADLRRQIHEQNEQRRLQNLQKREEELMMIEDAALADLEKAKAEERKNMEKRNDARKAMLMNETLMKSAREERLMKDREETKKCEDEVTRRTRIDEARIALEKRHFEEKQKMRKLLSDEASKELKQRAMKEFEIFERDQQKRQQKEKELNEADRLKREAHKLAIEECRRNQIQYLKQKEEVEKKMGMLYTEERNREHQLQLEFERQKEAAKRQRNAEVMKAQLQQCNENAQKRSLEKTGKLEEDQKAIEKLKGEDDLFNEFISKEMNRFKIQGKMTIAK
mmetsp:Transcript_13606/g.28898  ORF Transcript_13606/g.28898 Transcript_13606/m.28898 type:complete len:450 (-) Transcript_13606:66-1415(-)